MPRIPKQRIDSYNCIMDWCEIDTAIDFFREQGTLEIEQVYVFVGRESISLTFKGSEVALVISIQDAEFIQSSFTMKAGRFLESIDSCDDGLVITALFNDVVEEYVVALQLNGSDDYEDEWFPSTTIHEVALLDKESVDAMDDDNLYIITDRILTDSQNDLLPLHTDSIELFFKYASIVGG